MKTYKAENGVTFNYRVIKKGDHYGRNDCLTHDKSDAMIEFYDDRFKHTDHGQFVSRYYIKTLIDHLGDHTGLCLDGGISEWSIDADTLCLMLQDAIIEALKN